MRFLMHLAAGAIFGAVMGIFFPIAYLLAIGDLEGFSAVGWVILMFTAPLGIGAGVIGGAIKAAFFD